VRLVGAELVADLHAMLAESRFLVLVPELTPQAKGMIGAKELAALPKGAIVVNTGRGQVLDFAALNDALDSGHLFAAGVDAYFPEPLPADHPLLRNPKVTLTPHVAGGTAEATLQLARSAVDQITTALGGAMPTFPLNRAAWDGPHSRRPKNA
jgi:D-3-phosphoglycerate dehydrogenase